MSDCRTSDIGCRPCDTHKDETDSRCAPDPAWHKIGLSPQTHVRSGQDRRIAGVRAEQAESNQQQRHCNTVGLNTAAQARVSAPGWGSQHRGGVLCCAVLASLALPRLLTTVPGLHVRTTEHKMTKLPGNHRNFDTHTDTHPPRVCHTTQDVTRQTDDTPDR